MAPSPVQKAARRAGRAAPAVAVVGALAAIPQVRDLVAGGPAAGGPAAATKTVAQDRIGGAAAARHQESPARRRPAADPAHRAVTRDSAPAIGDTAVPMDPASPSAPPASPSPAPGGTVTCSAPASGMVPDNYGAIVSFLTSHGYTGNAAAGIAGNIYQESGGNPESVGSGGGGLIGWTPLPSGLVTGNPSADLQAQLEAILTYNDGWSQYIPALNAASSPAAAADIYVTDFERAGVPAAGTREESAEAVARACGI